MERQKQQTQHLNRLTEESRLNKTEINDAVKISIDLLQQESPPISEVVNAIANMHYSVVAPFVEEMLTNVSVKTQHTVLESFLASEKIRQNANRYGFRRILIWIETFLNKNSNPALISGLLLNASQQYKKKGSDGKLDSFLAAKISQLDSLDYSRWQEEELKDFLSWIAEICNRYDDERLRTECLEFVQSKTNGKSPIFDLETKDPGQVVSLENKEKPTDETIDKEADKFKKEVDRILPMHPVESGKNMLKELERILTELHNEKNHYKVCCNELKSDVEKLSNEKKNLEKQMALLNEKNRKLEESTAKLCAINDAFKVEKEDLQTRLETIVQGEENQAKFELDAFKGDVLKVLDGDYKGFVKIRNMVRQEGDVDIFIDMLEDVFGKLKKKGIQF